MPSVFELPPSPSPPDYSDSSQANRILDDPDPEGPAKIAAMRRFIFGPPYIPGSGGQQQVSGTAGTSSTASHASPGPRIGIPGPQAGNIRLAPSASRGGSYIGSHGPSSTAPSSYVPDAQDEPGNPGIHRVLILFDVYLDPKPGKPNSKAPPGDASILRIRHDGRPELNPEVNFVTMGLEEFKEVVLAQFGSIQRWLPNQLAAQDRDGKVSWTIAIAGDHKFGSNKKVILATGEDWLRFATRAKDAKRKISVFLRGVDPAKALQQRAKDSDLNLQLESIYAPEGLSASERDRAVRMNKNPNADESVLQNIIAQLEGIHQRVPGKYPGEGPVVVNPGNPQEFFLLNVGHLNHWAELHLADRQVSLHVAPPGPSFQYQKLGEKRRMRASDVAAAKRARPERVAGSSDESLPSLRFDTPPSSSPGPDEDGDLEDFLRFCKIPESDVKTRQALAAESITEWTFFFTRGAGSMMDTEAILRSEMGIPRGPTRQLVLGARKYRRHLRRNAANI